MTIMPAASIAMSQSATLPPFPTETILLSAITTVSPRATGAARSPLRIFPMLKTATFIASGRLPALLDDDFLMRQSADARIEASAIGYAEDHGDFVRHWRVRQHDRHAVVMRAHVNLVLVVHRNVDQRPRPALLGEGGNPGVAAADRRTNRIGEGRGQKRIRMLLLAGEADDSALAVALHLVLAEARERKLGHALAEFDAGIDHWPQILDVAPSVGILHHGDSGDASQPLVRGASGLLEALFHDNERAPGAKLHGVILTFGFRRSCALSADLSIQYADDAVCADRTKQNRMLNFNVEDRVGTIVIERVSAGNAFTEAMVRQLGEIIRRAAEEADIVTLSSAVADFTIAIAAANTRFALDEVKLGIPPMFILEQILEHLPAKCALDFILTGREFGADEALQIGLVSHVVAPADLDSTVGKFVATLCSRDRRVVLACKSYLRAVAKMPPEVRSAYTLVEQTQ